MNREIEPLRRLIPRIRVLAIFLFVPTMLSCSKPRPLTPRELAVELALGTQRTSIDLQKVCEPLEMKTVKSIYQARIVGAQLDAHIAQIILAGEGKLEVRYWRCPQKPSAGEEKPPNQESSNKDEALAPTDS